MLVIDDGSTDKTAAVARAWGAHVVRHNGTMGLARSFRDGIYFALARGADIVVNTDGDNQYPQERIPDLIEPILRGRADIVIGDRQTAQISHFSRFKRAMQSVGSGVVNKAARTELPDAASGFRAYSRASLLRINIITEFSYCMETIIQAGNRRLRIESVKVDTNPKTRESRLFKNMWHHMFKSGLAIVRSYLMFRPYILLATLGTIFGVLALVPFVRFGLLWLLDNEGGHIQSLIFGTSMLVASLLCYSLLIIADLQRTNRILLEESLERIKNLQFGNSKEIGSGMRVGSNGVMDLPRAVGISHGPLDLGSAEWAAEAGPDPGGRERRLASGSTHRHGAESVLDSDALGVPLES